MEFIYYTVVLSVAMAIATVTDIRHKKIPNNLTLPFFVVALFLTIIYKPDTLASSVLACVIIFAFGSFGIMGMGDLKFVMGLTMMVGWWSSVIGLGISCLLLVVYRFLVNKKEVIKASKIAKKVILTQNINLINTKAKRYPFAPFLSIGYFTVFLLGLGGII